jgi:hypothetical protein
MANRNVTPLVKKSAPPKAPAQRLALEYMAPGALKLRAKNPKVTKDLAVLEESFKQYGFVNPVIAYRNAKGAVEVSTGHHRVKQAKAQGLKEIPVIIVPWFDEHKARGFNVMDNRSAELVSEWAPDVLRAEVDALMAQTDPLPLAAYGFDDATLAAYTFIEPEASAAAPHTNGTPIPGEHAAPPPPATNGQPKGVAPNVRIPLVFYADTQEQAQRVRAAFAHARRDYELNATLLLAVLDYLQTNAAENFKKLQEQSVAR